MKNSSVIPKCVLWIPDSLSQMLEKQHGWVEEDHVGILPQHCGMYCIVLCCNYFVSVVLSQNGSGDFSIHRPGYRVVMVLCRYRAARMSHCLGILLPNEAELSRSHTGCNNPLLLLPHKHVALNPSQTPLLPAIRRSTVTTDCTNIHFLSTY